MQREPFYFAGMVKLVKALGSNPRDSVGSTPTPRTKFAVKGFCVSGGGWRAASVRKTESL